MSKIYFGEVNIINKRIIVPIYIDTEGENVNAFDIKIKFPNSLIFRDWNDAGSIINFWVEKPNIHNDLLQFSGVSIGGYVGRKGPLVNLIFEKTQTNTNSIQTIAEKIFLEILPSSKILLNDGLGTEAKLIGENRVFKISELKTIETFIDNYPPEPFKIYIYKNREIFDGKYFIVFQTTDKQSGIAYYEVAEKQDFFKPKIEDLIFKKTSPFYILKDQTLRSYIFVKAVDKFGNERIEYLKPKNLLSFDEVVNILIFGIFVFLLIKLVYNKWKSKFLEKQIS